MSDFLSPFSAPYQPLAVGIDLIEVVRIADALARFGTRFLNRVYTAREQEIVGLNASRLAGRFAVKEACAKALGTGIGVVRWTDIECLRQANGQPELLLHGEAATLARSLHWESIAVSISTTHQFSTAIVAALCGSAA